MCLKSVTDRLPNFAATRRRQLLAGTAACIIDEPGDDIRWHNTAWAAALQVRLPSLPPRRVPIRLPLLNATSPFWQTTCAHTAFNMSCRSTAFADRPGSEVKPRSNCTAQRNKLPPLRSESGTAPERSAHSWPAGTLRRPSMFAAQGSVCPGMRPTECAPIMFQCHAHGSSSGLDGGLAATTNMPGEGTTSPERVAELCRGVASMALWEEQDPGRMDDVCRTEAALGTPLAPRVPALPGCDQGPQSPQGSLACCTAAAQDCQVGCR